jgi:hypothetical protein
MQLKTSELVKLGQTLPKDFLLRILDLIKEPDGSITALVQSFVDQGFSYTVKLKKVDETTVEASCSCEAQQYGNPCHHTAAVFRRLLEEATPPHPTLATTPAPRVIALSCATTLAGKLAEVMAEVGYIQKDATNAFHKYKYASAEAVLRKANAALSRRGVAVSSHAELLRHELTTEAGKTKLYAVIKISADFTDGIDSVHAEGIGEASDTGDKAVMKANTAALKYLLANAFMISWGDDPEADPTADE